MPNPEGRPTQDSCTLQLFKQLLCYGQTDRQCTLLFGSIPPCHLLLFMEDSDLSLHRDIGDVDTSFRHRNKDKENTDWHPPVFVANVSSKCSSREVCCLDATRSSAHGKPVASLVHARARLRAATAAVIAKPTCLCSDLSASISIQDTQSHIESRATSAPSGSSAHRLKRQRAVFPSEHDEREAKRDVNEDINTLVQGANFMKYGRLGEPHRTLVSFSADMTAVFWHKKYGMEKKESLPTSELKSVMAGRSTSVFAKHLEAAIEERCLSVRSYLFSFRLELFPSNLF